MEEDLTGDDPVPGGVDVDAVVGEPEARVSRPLLGEESLHGAVDVDDIPALGPLGQQPVGVAVQHVVVALVGLAVLGEAGRQGLRLDRHRVEDRRRDVEHLRSDRRPARAGNRIPSWYFANRSSLKG